VISEGDYFGGDNGMIPLSYLVIAIICFALVSAFVVKRKLHPKIFRE